MKLQELLGEELYKQVAADIDGMEMPYPTQLDACRITPIGIEYLCDNSFMEKAKKFLKDIKEITPFT